ncbi:hypothetical protein TAO_1790 [Candidatus Nitrosoglobus terrae]|uniref:EF-hand domain-containing protein n=1 Tax=Candidatus Nitrosoglobus terrae TaxID=1630141 RepID=A0A1Q2SPT7_9GAMM|nr:EF-hand domain-containing protein [Candidatus Nitrosoglobus terrae]BAW81160.1 hypothetical protein TAO_1790 [Candidatus Nitrosoglobus terrae]
MYIQATNRFKALRAFLLGGFLSLVLAPAFGTGAMPFPVHPNYWGKLGEEYKEIDRNKDDQISKREFEEAADVEFDELDANHDGYISEEEFSHFECLDTNHDGYISTEEFKANSGRPCRRFR